MSDWVAELRIALDEEFGPRPPVVVLATVDPDGRPHARSVVCRRVEPDGSIGIASDARSAKNEHVRRNPAVELVVWLAAHREQFRVAGTVELMTPGVGDATRRALWRELTDASRALFFWPTSGAPRVFDPSVFPKTIADVTPPPETFEVLRIIPRHVEHLALAPHPHHLRRWREETGWSEEELNP